MDRLPGEPEPERVSRRRRARREVMELRTQSAIERDSGGTRLYGQRKEFVAIARQLVNEAKADLQKDFAQDHQWRKDWIAVLKKGALALDRTATPIVAAIHELIHQQPLLVIEFLRQKGIESESELDSIVETMKAAEGSDILTAIERCTAFLEGALPMHEEHRATIIRRLGGYLPVESNGAVSE